MTEKTTYTKPAGWKHNEFLMSRNPFNSPNLSTSSLNDSEHSGTSGQDEFHLERYNEATQYAHLRQISRSTNEEEKDRKPDLNLITNFAGPKMPMKDTTVVVNEVVSKKAQTDRKVKTISIISHKAVQSAVSPPDEAKNFARKTGGGLLQLRLASRAAKRNHEKSVIKQKSLFTQRIPFGITIPRANPAMTEQNSALPVITPMTPAIVVTPAGENEAWLVHRQGADGEQLSASSVNSTIQRQFTQKHSHSSLAHSTKDVTANQQEYYGSNSPDSARPKSQGWWNLMLSPLLRAGSVASRKGRHAGETPPVPPLPFTTAKEAFSAVSARSDPSLLVSAAGTSPDTPRRLGLASARASTWSRWTEWENEREAHARSAQSNEGYEDEKQHFDQLTISKNAASAAGLAAEYFHACAVDEATGRAYFECVGHSCLEHLPKLQSIHDVPAQKNPMLGSPFQSPLTQEDTKMSAVIALSPTLHDKTKTPTVIEDALSPDEFSPNVRQANTALATKARTLDVYDNKGTSDQDISENSMNNAVTSTAGKPPPQDNNRSPHSTTVAPPPQLIEIKVTHNTQAEEPQIQVLSEKLAVVEQPLLSPPPISPAGEKALAPTDGVSLTEHNRRMAEKALTANETEQTERSQLPSRPAFINAETEFPPPPGKAPNKTITAADIFLTDRSRKIEKRRQRNEQEDATAKKVGGLWRGRGCLSTRGCMGRGGTQHRTKRRWVSVIALLILAIIITSVVLAVTLTRRGDRTPVQSQWLNLTGFPPMPTGISTIAAPNLIAEQKQCVSPSTLWSCSVSKEDQTKIGTNQANQPNFRFEIKFRNGTVDANLTIPLPGSATTSGESSKDPFSNDIFVPNPTPPNEADQTFLGQTTDNITAPFDGEKTPFFITFMSSFPQIPDNLNNSDRVALQRRQSNSSSLLDAIPAPEQDADGSALAASLLPIRPFPISQPVRLYNRNLQDEHYGFYMYYDKTIYLAGVSIVNGKPANTSRTPAEIDQDGGSPKSQANAMCTFSESRFLVKIFTNPIFEGSLLPTSTNVNLTDPEDRNRMAQNSSATNFDRPGSFPYPATIAIDRHGGDIDDKAVYCYGMNGGQIVDSAKILAGEIRSFGGQLVNAAPAIVDLDDKFNRTAGGIDGGTGGCFCNWQNWQ